MLYVFTKKVQLRGVMKQERQSIYSMNKRNITVALLAAILIGSLMNLVNNYDVFTGNRFTGRNVFKIVLTYIIPFCVSLYSSVRATKQKA